MWMHTDAQLQLLLQHPGLIQHHWHRWHRWRLWRVVVVAVVIRQHRQYQYGG
jgi:hypothetical protein